VKLCREEEEVDFIHWFSC